AQLRREGLGPAPLFNHPTVGAAMADRKILEPGTPLASSEELLPGSNTYDDGTDIRAAAFGVQYVDPKTMAISVLPAGKAVGCIKAFGPSGNQLVLKDGKLRDPETNQLFSRKLANDYGSGQV